MTIKHLKSHGTMAALYMTSGNNATSPLIKKLSIHPPNATRILLPDGRHLAYQEQGVPAEKARFSLIAPHAFLSSRLAGANISLKLFEECSSVCLLLTCLALIGETRVCIFCKNRNTWS